MKKENLSTEDLKEYNIILATGNMEIMFEWGVAIGIIDSIKRQVAEIQKTPVLDKALKDYEREVPLVSECCGAGTYDDYMMCEDCKEHCGTERAMTMKEWCEDKEVKVKNEDIAKARATGN